MLCTGLSVWQRMAWLPKGGDLAGDGQYLVEVNESEAQVSDEAGVCKRLEQIATMEVAEVLVLLDHGPRQRNWLQRLLGISDRIVEPCFWLGKAGEVAALTFLDGAWSEYRATDPAYPVEATLEQRQAPGARSRRPLRRRSAFGCPGRCRPPSSISEAATPELAGLHLCALTRVSHPSDLPPRSRRVRGMHQLDFVLEASGGSRHWLHRNRANVATVRAKHLPFQCSAESEHRTWAVALSVQG